MQVGLSCWACVSWQPPWLLQQLLLPQAGFAAELPSGAATAHGAASGSVLAPAHPPLQPASGQQHNSNAADAGGCGLQRGKMFEICCMRADKLYSTFCNRNSMLEDYACGVMLASMLQWTGKLYS